VLTVASVAAMVVVAVVSIAVLIVSSVPPGRRRGR